MSTASEIDDVATPSVGQAVAHAHHGVYASFLSSNAEAVLAGQPGEPNAAKSAGAGAGARAQQKYGDEGELVAIWDSVRPRAPRTPPSRTNEVDERWDASAVAKSIPALPPTPIPPPVEAEPGTLRDTPPPADHNRAPPPAVPFGMPPWRIGSAQSSPWRA